VKANKCRGNRLIEPTLHGQNIEVLPFLPEPLRAPGVSVGMPETILWHLVADRLPDDGLTVLVQCAPDANEPIWLGYLDGNTWRDVDASTMKTPVAWADLPIGVLADGGCSGHRSWVAGKEVAA
jgi:hypothetical protein